jgi:hypothetical protein
MLIAEQENGSPEPENFEFSVWNCQVVGMVSQVGVALVEILLKWHKFGLDFKSFQFLNFVLRV